jgi:hypothetical protein
MKLPNTEQIKRWQTAMKDLFALSEELPSLQVENRLFELNDKFYAKLAKHAEGISIDEIIADTDDDSGDEEDGE